MAPRPRAATAQRDGAALGAADPFTGPVDGQPVERHAVRRQDQVARRRPALRRRRARQRRHDDEAAVRAQRRAALGPVGGLGRDLRADALELAADALEGVVVLLRGQVRGVRVTERLDHAADGALDERVAVDLAARVAVVDRVVRVPEGPERGILADRRARLEGGLATHRVAGHEQRAAGEQRDDDDGGHQDRGGATGRRQPAGPRAGRGRPARSRRLRGLEGSGAKGRAARRPRGTAPRR